MEMSKLLKLKLKKWIFKRLTLSWMQGSKQIHTKDNSKGILIFLVGTLTALVAEWTLGGTALTSLMDVKMRHDNEASFKPVIVTKCTPSNLYNFCAMSLVYLEL